MSNKAEASSRRPSTSLSPRIDESPMFFTRDQCPSSGKRGMTSFGRSEEDVDSMSLAASDCEEWENSSDDSGLLLLKQVDEA